MRRQSKIIQTVDAFLIMGFAVMFMRVPDSIRLMLPIITLLSMVAVGYKFGLTGERSWVVIFFLVAAFSTVITLIADMDRPQGGLVQVIQQPLRDLLLKFCSPGS